MTIIDALLIWLNQQGVQAAQPYHPTSLISINIGNGTSTILLRCEKNTIVYSNYSIRGITQEKTFAIADPNCFDKILASIQAISKHALSISIASTAKTYYPGAVTVSK